MPTLTFDTLKALRSSTRREYCDALYDQHHWVKLFGGGWSRSLGPPQLLPDQKSWGLYLVPTGSPRVWHMKLRDGYPSPLLDR